MRIATVSDAEFVLITILSPERPHVILVCSAIIIFSSLVTLTVISISPSAKISLRVFAPFSRIVFANSPERVTVPFSSVTPSVASVPARPPPMRIATVSDAEFVLITILSPERPHVILVCSAMITFSSSAA